MTRRVFSHRNILMNGEAQAGLALLVIDDDVDTCQWLAAALKPFGWTVQTANSGAEGISIATRNAFDFLLVDLRLPDMSGTQLIRALREAGVSVPFVLISGFLTTESTVNAMRLGAIDVIEKPVVIDDLMSRVSSAVSPSHVFQSVQSRTRRGDLSARYLNGPLSRPRSAAERWAMLMLRACESRDDPKTLEDWAKCAGVSYSSLRESCRLLDIRPHDARDLVRVLRAVIRSHVHGCPPGVLLDVSDSRTLENLLTRAGIREDARAGPVSIEVLLDSQRLVDNNNEGMRVLRRLFLLT